MFTFYSEDTTVLNNKLRQQTNHKVTNCDFYNNNNNNNNNN